MAHRLSFLWPEPGPEKPDPEGQLRKARNVVVGVVVPDVAVHDVHAAFTLHLQGVPDIQLLNRLQYEEVFDIHEADHDEGVARKILLDMRFAFSFEHLQERDTANIPRTEWCGQHDSTTRHQFLNDMKRRLHAA